MEMTSDEARWAAAGVRARGVCGRAAAHLRNLASCEHMQWVKGEVQRCDADEARRCWLHLSFPKSERNTLHVMMLRLWPPAMSEGGRGAGARTV